MEDIWEQINKDIEDLERKYSFPSGQRVRFAHPLPGTTRIRILPPTPGATKYYEIVGRHVFPNPDNPGSIKIYLCKNITYKKQCPICEVYKTLESAKGKPQSTDPVFDDVLRGLRPEVKGYFNAVILGWRRENALPEEPFVVNQNYPQEQPVVFIVPRTVLLDILNLHKVYFRNLVDLERGANIDIKRVGTGRNTTYSLFVPQPEVPLPHGEDYLSKAYDLRAVIAEFDLSYEDLINEFYKNIQGVDTSMLASANAPEIEPISTLPVSTPTQPAQYYAPPSSPVQYNIPTPPPQPAQNNIPTPPPQPAQNNIPTPQPEADPVVGSAPSNFNESAKEQIVEKLRQLKNKEGKS